MRLFLSLTEEEVQAFDKARNKAGMTRSQYLKCLLSGRRDIRPPALQYRDMIHELDSIERDLKVIAMKEDLPEEPYFTILSQDGRNIEIKSNNTGHCWNLIYEENTYTLMHKHDQKDNYHFQTIIGNLYDTILYIVGHDEYQMRNRNTVSVEEEKRSNSYFWKLIDIYGLTA